VGDRFYRGVVGTGRLAIRALDLRVELTGDERVPRHGPVVLAANHVSFLDFLLVGLAADRSRRLVRFLTRHEVVEHRVARRVMTAMDHVPVDRGAPAAAYLHARRLLGEGEAVGVFPEAGVSRSYTVRALMPGAAALARETGAPLVPIAIWGPQRLLTAKQRPEIRRGRPVSLRVGEPLDVSTTDVVAATRHLGTTLQRMLDTLQREDRHQPAPDEEAVWHPAHLGGHALTVAGAERLQDMPRSAVPPTWSPGRQDR
jgi:1-acyl-sn-glycerol-3-phosphate acyltransferase